MTTLYYDLTKNTFCPGFITQIVNKLLCKSRSYRKTDFKY